MTKEKIFSFLEIAIILILASIPLFISFPFRVNVFISWEGAYRLSMGELPFRDFGTALGGMYWVIPSIFFKIFGVQLITLVKAQVFINILSGLAFRSILKNLSVKNEIIFISILLFCISYSFFNFWPWYNHSVIVYQLIGMAFILQGAIKYKLRILWILAGALFTCFSFLTKQDAGGMAFIIGLLLLTYTAFIDKKWYLPLLFGIGFILSFILITFPFYNKGFSYWFNYGQSPHTARISFGDILSEFFQGSMWIKFYLFFISLTLIGKVKQWKIWIYQKKDMLLLIVTLAILGEAVVFQVTSYTPPDNNIFYHGFAFAYILHWLVSGGILNLNRISSLIAVLAGLMIWWSSTYWKYIQRISERIFPINDKTISISGENIVNRHTYILTNDTTEIPMSQWGFTDLNTFHRIYMPIPTVEGIKRLMNMDLVKQRKPIRVLNMTELTPLAVEIPYDLERDQQYPLWYHLGVSMFNQQADMLEKKIKLKEYELILFEYIPNLNNFFAFRVRDSIRSHYKLVDTFMAPRRGETKGTIEVYIK